MVTPLWSIIVERYFYWESEFHFKFGPQFVRLNPQKVPFWFPNRKGKIGHHLTQWKNCPPPSVVRPPSPGENAVLPHLFQELGRVALPLSLCFDWDNLVGTLPLSSEKTNCLPWKRTSCDATDDVISLSRRHLALHCHMVQQPRDATVCDVTRQPPWGKSADDKMTDSRRRLTYLYNVTSAFWLHGDLFPPSMSCSQWVKKT